MDMERGLALIHQGFKKLQSSFESHSESCVALTSDEYMKQHTTVYGLCRGGDSNAAELYAAYRAILCRYLTADVMPSLRRRHGESLLSELYARWDAHTHIAGCLSRSSFDYLDRCYLRRRSLPTLREAGVMCFKDVVFEELKGRATEAILALVERERRDEGAADRALVRRVAVDVCLAMGMGEMRCYEEDFEAAMLEATSEYYSRKAASWIEVMSSPEYMAMAEKALRKEKNRVDRYLHPSSWPKVAERVRQELLVVHATRLFENEDTGFRALVQGDEKTDVEAIFRVYRELPEQLQQVAELFRIHVTEEVRGLVQAAEDASTEVIKKLIQLHDRYYDVYLNNSFKKHEFFQKALTSAFEEFGAKPVAAMTSAELIAIFLDEILKKGGSNNRGRMINEDIDNTLESTVQLLTYVHDKDMFIEFYRKKLAHRLLSGHSANLEHEKSVLAMMKQRFGVEFTFNMEGMIKDMTMTKENDDMFEKYLCENSLLTVDGVSLSATVITINKWPNYKSSNLTMPAEMARSAEAYAKFFSVQYPNKKLTWLHTLGTCHIKAEFAAKTFELVVSTYQALVLSLFNANDALSYSDIKAELNIGDDDEENDEELVRTLHSLSCAKYKILLKKPASKTVSKSDVFEFNAEFDDPMRRIKVPLPSVAAEKERKKAARAVDTDRRYAVDCAIVRIMKARNVLDHRSLMTECIEYLSSIFKPDVKLIKKRIQELIEREFIERDETDSALLKYIA